MLGLNFDDVFACYILSSDSSANKIIKEFNERYTKNNDKQKLLNNIISDLNINVDDLTDYDKVRIEETINNA